MVRTHGENDFGLNVWKCLSAEWERPGVLPANLSFKEYIAQIHSWAARDDSAGCTTTMHK